MIAGIAGTSSAFVFLITYQYELATVLFVIAIALLSRSNGRYVAMIYYAGIMARQIRSAPDQSGLYVGTI